MAHAGDEFGLCRVGLFKLERALANHCLEGKRAALECTDPKTHEHKERQGEQTRKGRVGRRRPPPGRGYLKVEDGGGPGSTRVRNRGGP